MRPLHLLPFRAACAATLLLPLFLLHGRGVADALVILVAALFLLRSGLERSWTWLRAGWVPFALAWWGWLVLCSALSGWASVAQAAGIVRFLLFVAALEGWVLRDAAMRRWVLRLVQAAALYIALQAAIQFAFGRNLFGYPRWGDGELTGPYAHPRAAAPFVRLLFPAVLPVLGAGIARAGWRGAGAGVLVLASLALVVLMGQRMPLLLAGLGLFAAALLLPRLRRAVLVMALLAGALVAGSRAVSPEAHYRLVTKFSAQMSAFPTSPYGQLAARSVAMIGSHPITGLGFDGFRRRCDDPAFFRGWGGGDGGGAGICVQHPHNFYMQAGVEAGLPGLALFILMVGAWLHGLGRGLWRGLGRQPHVRRAGLFIAALLHLWPLSSTSAFTSMPLSGWFFLLLGLGLAEARAYMAAKTGAVPEEPRHA